MENKLSKYLSKQGLKYVLGFLFIFGINLLQVNIPKTQGDIVDLLTTQSFEKKQLTQYIIIIILLALGSFICHYFSRYYLLGANSMMDYNIRGDMFNHLLDLSMKYFDKNSVGEIMALSSNDLSRLRAALSRGLNMVANLVMLYLLAIIQMTTINYRLMLLVMIPFPIAIFIIFKYGPIIRKKHRKVQKKFADLTRVTQENISAIRLIKAFVREENEEQRFRKENTNNFNSQMQLVKIDSIFNPSIIFISTLSFLILLFVGGRMVINNQITLGEFIACNTYVAMLVRPIAMLGMIVGMIQQSKAAWKRIADLLNVPTEIDDRNVDKKNDLLNSKKLKGDITFEDVSFSYEEKEVLKKISLYIKRGTSLGIVGRIGSGKTTLINLLLRLYDIENKGSLKIDGIEIDKIPLTTLRENIAYVPQDNFLFSQTIYENIDFNLNGKSEETIINSAKISQIHESILFFKDGYDTKLGEKGVNLSGGQKQRISIARALSRKAPILILDDCLSAVDTKTEEAILKGIKNYSSKITTIIIAHRLSTVMHCDNIIVLENGEIAEQGNHSELIARDGLYAQMQKRQKLEKEIDK